MKVYLLVFFAFLSTFVQGQSIDRVNFNVQDSVNGYYLSIVPRSKQIKGVLVLFTSFLSPEDLLPESKLQNVSYVNDFLMVVVSTQQKLYADGPTVQRINTVLTDIIKRYAISNPKFALAGYDEAGGIALRYTELCYQHPLEYPILPMAVFGINTPVDLFSLWHWSERQIKKNYWQGSVGDSHYYIDNMTKENGTIYQNPQRYRDLTPFNAANDSTGNEQFLGKVAVRLYYDTDIDWQLRNRRNSFYDTFFPDGSELIKRLMLMGNNQAEFISSKQPGVQNNGKRHPNSMSIVDEVEAVMWLKKGLNIFDPTTWVPPYKLDVPKGWNIERFSLPADFAPQMSFQGVEDLRFTPGWGDSVSIQHWTYAFVWWLQGQPLIDSASLRKNLQLYYQGLVGRNIINRNIPDKALVPLIVNVQKLKTSRNDRQTFSGEINMLDYHTQRPILLHLLIHDKFCSVENSAILIEISPQPKGSGVWKELQQLAEGYQCPLGH